MYKVSVIIPVYNVEKYIKRCAVSLFEQTLNGIQFIFIDDCSLDLSIQILKQVINKYPHLKHDIRIISNERNRGSAFARNIGVSVAEGEYVIGADSDDWVDSTAYEEMYEFAKKTDSDIVVCGYIEEYNSKSIIHKVNGYSSPDSFLRASLSGEVHNSVWNKLVRRSIYEKYQIRCIEGFDMLEDTLIMPQLIYYSQRVSFIDKCFYHYFKGNECSYTAKNKEWPKRTFDSIIGNTNALVQFLENNPYGRDYHKEIEYLKINSKMLLLIFSKKRNRSLYHHLYRVSTPYIWTNSRLNFIRKLTVYFSSLNLTYFSDWCIAIIHWRGFLKAQLSQFKTVGKL